MILTVNQGSFAYGAQPVLDRVSFSAGPGELVAILGPNGAGKTTLLRCTMGMLKWSSGTSAIDGECIAAMSARELWKKLAYVPQARSTATACTALQSVLLGRSSRLNVFSRPAKADVDYALSVLERLGIAHLAEKSCSAMSGGELQMVLIARALAAEPQILILDEPESNLDFKNQLIVLDTMSELARSGMTCIFNTHYPAHALQRANKALLLHKGGACVFGDTADVVTAHNIRQAFGVEAVVGEIETDQALFQSVIPLRLADQGGPQGPQDADRQTIAGLSLLFDDNDKAGQINDILHEYSAYIVGRMGMPYKAASLYIIYVTLHAPESVLRRLYQKISLLRDVSAKLTFSQQKEVTSHDQS